MVLLVSVCYVWILQLLWPFTKEASYHTDLRKKFFSPSTWLHIMQCIVGILYHAVPEGTQAKLYHGPVVENLDGVKVTQIIRE